MRESLLHPEAPNGLEVLDFIRRRAAEHLPPGATSILDAGSGNGPISHQLGGARRVVALDLVPKAVSGREVAGNVASLPFPDASFDAVTCVNVITMLTHVVMRAGLFEMVRVLKPGGVLILTSPNLDHPLIRYRSFLRKRRTGHTQPWAVSDAWLRNVLSLCGAGVVVRDWILPAPYAVRGGKRWLARRFAAVAMMFPRLCPHAVWVARRNKPAPPSFKP